MNDVDILSADRVLDFAAALAAREFCKDAVTRGHAEDVADVVCELGVGITSQNNDIADHCVGEDVIVGERG